MDARKGDALTPHGTAASVLIGSTWRTTPNPNARRKVRAGSRLIRQAHNPGKCNRYNADDDLIRAVQASIARDMLALIPE